MYVPHFSNIFIRVSSYSIFSPHSLISSMIWSCLCLHFELQAFDFRFHILWQRPVDFIHFWSISSMNLLISHIMCLFCNVSLPSCSLLYPLRVTTSLFILWMESVLYMPFLSLVTASVSIVFVILTTIPLKASQNSWCSFQTSLEKHVSRGMFKCGSYLIHWLQVISL